jgi:hypothetical protein
MHADTAELKLCLQHTEHLIDTSYPILFLLPVMQLAKLAGYVLYVLLEPQ